MEIYKDQPNKKNKAIYSDFTIAWESATITRILTEMETGRGVGSYNEKREGSVPH